MRYSNLHTHTTYSDGKHTIRENIESAIEKQMLSIGISDHSYTDFDLTYCIKKEDIPRYIDEIRALREDRAQRWTRPDCSISTVFTWPLCVFTWLSYKHTSHWITATVNSVTSS